MPGLLLAMGWACDATEANQIPSPTWGVPAQGSRREGGRRCPFQTLPKACTSSVAGEPLPQSYSLETPACPSDLISYHFRNTCHIPATPSLFCSPDKANSFSPQDICTCCSLCLEHSAPDLPLHDWLLFIISASIRSVIREAFQEHLAEP